MIFQIIGSEFFLMISMLLFSTSLGWFSNYASCINSLILDPRNTPLIFASHTGGKLRGTGKYEL